MSRPFDPYEQWLGIPPHEQPPDHYRLLGIKRFESDPEIILAAAEQRMAQIRIYQTGPRSSYTQPLLNELAAAKLRLLNPVSKKQYDAALADAVSLSEGRFSAELLPPSANEEDIESGPEPPSGAGASLAAQFPIQVHDSPGTRTNGRSGRSRSYRWWLMLVSTNAVVAAGIIWWGLQRTANSGSQPVKPTPVVSKPPLTTTIPQFPTSLPQDDNGDIRLTQSNSEPVGRVAGTSRSPKVTTGSSLSATSQPMGRWVFKVTRLPAQGVFRTRVTYVANRAKEDAKYTIVLDGAPRARGIQPSDSPSSSAEVVDEFFLAVRKTGEHELELHTSGSIDGFRLKSIELLFR